MKTKNWLFITMSILFLILIGLYIYQVTFFNSHFFPKTTANGLDISQLTKKEAEKVLAAKSDSDLLTLTENGQPWKEVPKKELGIEYDYSKGLDKVFKKQNSWLWPIGYIKSETYSVADTSLNEAALASYSATLKEELTTLNADRTPSKNASIKKEDVGFMIAPEVQGDDLDVESILKALPEHLKEGKDTLDLESFKTSPEIKADDPALKKSLADITKLTNQSIEYYINGQTIKVGPEVISEWITFDETTQKASLDKEKVRSYVANLGESYNTSTNPTLFKSTARGEVSIPAGTFSWTIQTDAETEELYNALLAGEGVQRSPIAQGSTSVQPALIGNTYIEIDLANQHMYYYKDGSIALETDIVSGKPSTPTPPGVNYVWKKELNATLRGTNDDGSKYAEPVDFWMPIDWTGVGIHDSDWQPAYGGQLWKTVGSHGCINTPPGVMKELYAMIEVGVPVLVF